MEGVQLVIAICDLLLQISSEVMSMESQITIERRLLGRTVKRKVKM